jgi:hypothetical protein
MFCRMARSTRLETTSLRRQRCSRRLVSRVVACVGVARRRWFLERRYGAAWCSVVGVVARLWSVCGNGVWGRAVCAEEAAARAWWSVEVPRWRRWRPRCPRKVLEAARGSERRARVGWRRWRRFFLALSVRTCGGGGCRVALHHCVRLCVVAVCRAETAGLVCVGCVVSRRVALVTWPVNLGWGGVGWGGVGWGGVCACARVRGVTVCV